MEKLYMFSLIVFIAISVTACGGSSGDEVNERLWSTARSAEVLSKTLSSIGRADDVNNFNRRTFMRTNQFVEDPENTLGEGTMRRASLFLNITEDSNTITVRYYGSDATNDGRRFSLGSSASAPFTLTVNRGVRVVMNGLVTMQAGNEYGRFTNVNYTIQTRELTGDLLYFKDGSLYNINFTDREISLVGSSFSQSF